MTTPGPDRDRLFSILSRNVSGTHMFSYDFLVDSDLIPANGFWSEFYTGRIINKDSGEVLHVFIKVSPKNNFFSYFEIKYKNEVYFYSEIFPKLNELQQKRGVRRRFNQIPRFVKGQLIKENEYLVLQNMTSAGYENVQSADMDSRHLELALKAFARFHALSFVYKNDQPEKFHHIVNNLEKVDRGKREVYVEYLEACCQTFVSTLEQLRNSQMIHKYLARAKSYRGKYSCLIHGDAARRNLMFKYQDSGELEDVKLVDFHLIRVSTPIYDLSSFFYSSAGKEDLDLIDYYLEVYYRSFSSFVEELGAVPEDIYPYRVLRNEWKIYSFLGLIEALSIGELLDTNDLMFLFNGDGILEEKYLRLWKTKMSKPHEINKFRERSRDLYIHARKYDIL